MGFTTPCYIRTNTPELRKKLEELGYKCYGNPFQITDTSRLITTLDGEYVPYNVQLDNSWMDCGTNEPLFLAIASLRDDTDYMQWYTDGSDFILCDREDWIDMYSVLCCGKEKGSNYQNELDKYSKATVVELINHFKE